MTVPTSLAALRDKRLDELIWQSYQLLKRAQDEIKADGKTLAATCLLFSGGNDSTVLAHLFRRVATHAVHANTGIGVEETRQFVRDTCVGWGLPLIEKHPPDGSTYEELVLERGFPGPGQHWKMYQRLKERALHAAVKDLIGRNYYTKRVIFLAGRRRDESARRIDVPEIERRKSIVWVSPLANWTKADLNTYRARYDVPRNEVADHLHMSGECLCGAFAKPDELDEIGFFYPQVKADIQQLEERVAAAGIPEPRCRWGWGADRPERASKTGPLCSSCTWRQEPLFDLAEAA